MQFGAQSAVLTFLLIGGVGEVEHSVLLQGSSCDCRIHQRVVEVHAVDGQGQAAVQAANQHPTVAVVVVLVSRVDDDAAIRHFERLQRCNERGRRCGV